MVSQPAYLKNLKAYSREQPHGDGDPAGYVSDLVSESDRGAVILAATTIEDMLEWACIARLPGLHSDLAAREPIFGVNGSAASFSNKIHLAYALGVIDRKARTEIDLIREMRNACAHARKPISFTLPQLQAACLKVIEDFLPLLLSREPAALRHTFALKCVLLNQYIVSGQRQSPIDLLREAVAEQARKAAR